MIKATNDSSSYQSVLNGLLRLHELFVAGKRQSDEVKQLRDAIDEPYLDLTAEERDVIEGLSRDLFDVERINSNSPTAPASYDERKFSEAIQARDQGQFDRALELLREAPHYSPFSKISYLRGSIWQRKGDDNVASIFLKHAQDRPAQDDQDSDAFPPHLKAIAPDEATK